MGLIHGFIVEMVDGDGEIVGGVESCGVNVSFGEDLTAGEIGSGARFEGGDGSRRDGEGEKGKQEGRDG